MQLKRKAEKMYGFEGDDVYDIIEPQIRDFGWQLIRRKGQGTYAKIAGPNYHHPEDQIFTIEEWAEPEHRKLWDEMSPEEAADLAFGALTPEPLAFFHVPESYDDDIFVMKRGRIFLIYPETGAPYEEHDALPEGAEVIPPEHVDFEAPDLP